MSTTADMNPLYRHTQDALHTLLVVLQENPDMPFQTERLAPKSSNKIYYAWDFVNTTLDMLHKLDPALPTSQAKRWQTIVDRCYFADEMINDTTGNAAARVMEHPDATKFTKDEKVAVKELVIGIEELTDEVD